MKRHRSRRARPAVRPEPAAPPHREERRAAGVNRPAKHTFRLAFPGVVEPVLIHSTQPFPWVKKRRNRRRDRIAAASRRANRTR